MCICNIHIIFVGFLGTVHMVDEISKGDREMREEIMVEGKLMWKYRGKLLEYPSLDRWI